MVFFLFSTVLSVAASMPAVDKWTQLHDGHQMPTISLGTCCGSKPQVGLAPWIAAGGVGIDTAIGYNNEPQIGSILKSLKVHRSSVFITSKTKAGCGEVADCAADPNVTLTSIKQSLQQLEVDYIDLMLLHRPCQQLKKKCSLDPGAAATQGNCTGPDLIKDSTAANNALWEGMQHAQKLGLVRSIGVSNYNAQELAALEGAVPVVNQCEMSVLGVDKVTLKYCQEHGIVYESFGAMRGCDWTAPAVTSAAAAHSVSAAQVCLRWVLQSTADSDDKTGVVLAVGTGNNASTAPGYGKENLGALTFSLTNAEMAALDTLGGQQRRR